MQETAEYAAHNNKQYVTQLMFYIAGMPGIAYCSHPCSDLIHSLHPAFSISYFYETGVSLDGIRIVVRFLLWYNNFYVSVALLFAARARKG